MYQKSLFLFFIAIMSCYQVVLGQQSFTVSGTIKDRNSGETLIGASVRLIGDQKTGAVSNSYGFYSLQATPGDYLLVADYAGYISDSLEVHLDHDLNSDIGLNAQSGVLDEVKVQAAKTGQLRKPLMGVEKLSVKEIENVPVIFGEKDVLKTLQLLPGIKSAGEGSSGFFVRGGSADQNLIQLDEATIYNASHLLGFFSAFNSDAIKDLTLYKGAAPAQYGGRLSSVVDVNMKDGNNQDFHANGGIGLISSRLSLEGPVVKDKGSFIVSGRRSYADLFLKLSNDSSINRNTLYFYDLNAKANYRFNDNNRLFLSGYFGKDKIILNNEFGIDYGNTTLTARWNHLFSGKLFSNTSFIYSDYNYNVKVTSGATDLLVKSKISDLTFKEDLEYHISGRYILRLGGSGIYHRINPGVIDASATSSYNSQHLQNKYSLESAIYIANEYTASERLKLNYGLRLTAYQALGPGEFYNYDNAGNIKDSTHYNWHEVVKNYFNLAPRFSASYTVNRLSSIKVSYARNIQHLHLLSNSASTNPTDLWIGSSQNVKPEIADQVAVGYYRDFGKGQFEFSSELYYKLLWNQIDYKDGAELRANEQVESQLLFGKGRAYGLELFLKKKYGRLTGWISYTLSRSERRIAGINDFRWYSAKQDQTHNIAIVGIYKLNNKWTLSGNWVYNTGNAVTFPSGKYGINGQTVFYYTERNAYRMPAYHRLDLSATIEGKKTKKWSGSWTFSLYNVYGRDNAYSITFENDPGDPSRTRAVQTSLFRWVPAVTYNFNF